MTLLSAACQDNRWDIYISFLAFFFKVFDAIEAYFHQKKIWSFYTLAKSQDNSWFVDLT